MPNFFKASGNFGLMKKNLLLFIIIFNSFALLGILLTQVYWVREAYRLQEDQFAGTIRIAIKGVANQMLNHLLLHPPDGRVIEPSESALYQPDAGEIDAGLLNFKITEEFKCMQVGQSFEYAVIDIRTNNFLKGNYQLYQEALLESRHQITMTGFEDSKFIILSVYFPDEHNLILMRMVNWLILSVVFAIILILAYFYTLYFFYRQKRLSEIKSDFINNMTHEFKTPLATISLASEMLMKKSVQEDDAKMQRYCKIIFDENSRLQNHVDQILKVSLLEKGRFRLKKKNVDIHELILQTLESFEISVRERNGSLNHHFCARKFIVLADPIHLTNVINNLLDNANKYSNDPPVISVGTFNDGNGIVISVEDKGIGISDENQHLIFKNLYRVPTGNLYNKKSGFGIGLYYVQTIVEAHGGHIKIKSAPDKGSRFDIYLPFVSNSPTDDAEDYSETKPATG
jgi:two-component system phosphate regulon sensor histidine kinase PhoR